jgi:hypothetical protein
VRCPACPIGNAMPSRLTPNRSSKIREPGRRAEYWSRLGSGKAHTSAFPACSKSKAPGTVSARTSSACFSLYLRRISTSSARHCNANPRLIRVGEVTNRRVRLEFRSRVKALFSSAVPCVTEAEGPRSRSQDRAPSPLLLAQIYSCQRLRREWTRFQK